MGLLKNAHLLCCAANRTTQRISIYASRFGFLRALHLNIFEQPQTWVDPQRPITRCASGTSSLLSRYPLKSKWYQLNGNDIDMFKRFYKLVSNEMHGEFVMSDVNVI